MDYKNLEVMSWLFGRLRLAGSDGITYDELVGPISSDSPMAVLWNKRTFHNYQNELKQWFGVEIECKRPEYRYRLKEPEVDNMPWTMPYLWAVESASAIKYLRDEPDCQQYVYVDNSPSGGVLVKTLLEAIRQQKRISVYYRPPNENRALPYPLIDPYWLWMKDYKWYLLGTLPGRQLIIYPLSNISQVVVTDRPCRRAPVATPKMFVEAYYKQEKERF